MSQWVQVNVALQRTEGPAVHSARRLFRALAPVLDEGRSDGRLHRFHFMRKPPDVRLRFEGPAPEDNLVPAIDALLRRLTVEGAVAHHFTSVYEPETRLFGGSAAMSLVHDHFDVDSRAWIQHDRMQATGTATLSAADLTTAVLNEIFSLALDDRGEVWDCWCNLCALLGSEPAAAPDAAEPALLPEGLMNRASTGERVLLARYRSANEALSVGLRRIWGEGRLECGLRAMLPFVGVFHFHRHGLDAGRQAAQAVVMTSAWDPRRGLLSS